MISIKYIILFWIIFLILFIFYCIFRLNYVLIPATTNSYPNITNNIKTNKNNVIKNQNNFKDIIQYLDEETEKNTITKLPGCENVYNDNIAVRSLGYRNCDDAYTDYFNNNLDINKKYGNNKTLAEISNYIIKFCGKPPISLSQPEIKKEDISNPKVPSSVGSTFFSKNLEQQKLFSDCTYNLPSEE
jgi:hypothetical protein